jgi:hypothetical protein
MATGRILLKQQLSLLSPLSYLSSPASSDFLSRKKNGKELQS